MLDTDDMTSSLGGGALIARGTQLATSGPPALVRKAATRNRPIFEFRMLGSQAPANLVQAGLALWDYVDLIHGRSQSLLSTSNVGRLWNYATSFL